VVEENELMNVANRGVWNAPVPSSRVCGLYIGGLLLSAVLHAPLIAAAQEPAPWVAEHVIPSTPLEPETNEPPYEWPTEELPPEENVEPPSCPYTLSLAYNHAGEQFGYDGSGIFSGGAVSELACLEDLFREAIEPLLQALHEDLSAQEVEDVLQLKMQIESHAVASGLGLSGEQLNLAAAIDRQVMTFLADRFGQDQCIRDARQGTRLLCGTRFLIGSECQPLAPPDAGDICADLEAGSAEAYLSPISLILDQGVNIDTVLSFVRFPIDPTNPHKWYTWRASAMTPLLVYAPAHDKHVQSGAQLFGNWTFFDSRAALLAPAPQTRVAAPLWKDGFEALATLDSNADGRLDGPELGDLALWFDYNQDGTLQRGELKTIAEAGILRLYVKPDFRDPVTRNLYARIGFERLYNNEVVQGATVDWYADSAESKTELVLRHQAREQLAGTPAPSTGHSADADAQLPLGPATARRHDRHLNGIWHWKVTPADKSKNTHGGYFTLRLEDGRVFGHNFIPLPMQDDIGNPSTLVSVMPIHGALQESQSDSTQFAFVIDNGSSRTESLATLSIDGQMLTGHSSVFVHALSTSQYEYTWSATPVSLDERFR
jgi:hypothetical protein